MQEQDQSEKIENLAEPDTRPDEAVADPAEEQVPAETSFLVHGQASDQPQRGRLAFAPLRSLPARARKQSSENEEEDEEDEAEEEEIGTQESVNAPLAQTAEAEESVNTLPARAAEAGEREGTPAVEADETEEDEEEEEIEEEQSTAAGAQSRRSLLNYAITVLLLG